MIRKFPGIVEDQRPICSLLSTASGHVLATTAGQYHESVALRSLRELSFTFLVSSVQVGQEVTPALTGMKIN